MTKIHLTPYDVAEHLRTPEEMAAYLEACIEIANGDAAFIARALGDIARAKGMAEWASTIGLSRTPPDLGRPADLAPSFATILQVINALGMRLTVVPATPTAG